MAVPKRKTSKSRRNMRRSHSALKEVTTTHCGNCGEITFPHHMCGACGHYKGRWVMKMTAQKDEEENEV